MGSSTSKGDTNSAGRRSWRRVAAIAAGSVVLSAGTLLASAGQATAVQCPPGTLLFFNACITIGIGAPPVTSPPATTPPTTSPPITLPPVTLPPVTLPPLPATPVNVPDAAQRLLDLANGERQRAGVGPLAMRGDIVSIALSHSETMAKAGDIFHSTSFFTSAVKRLLGASASGENVAYNGSIEDAHNRLMNSAGHRANILDGRFNTAGFAVVRVPDGRYFITEDFIQAAGAPRAAAAPRPAAPVVSRKAAPAPAPKPAPAPPTTAAPTTTTVAPPTTAAPSTAAPTAATPAVPLDATSSAVAATPVNHDGEVTAPLGGVAAILLAGAVGACCVVPRRRGC